MPTKEQLVEIIQNETISDELKKELLAEVSSAPVINEELVNSLLQKIQTSSKKLIDEIEESAINAANDEFAKESAELEKDIKNLSNKIEDDAEHIDLEVAKQAVNNYKTPNT